MGQRNICSSRIGTGIAEPIRPRFRVFLSDPDPNVVSRAEQEKGLAEADLEQELLIQIRVLWSDPRNFVGSRFLKSSDLDRVVHKSDPDSDLV